MKIEIEQENGFYIIRNVLKEEHTIIHMIDNKTWHPYNIRINAIAWHTKKGLYELIEKAHLLGQLKEGIYENIRFNT